MADVKQEPATLNSVSFLWDPTRDTGVFVKVHCISTEFTPKKHGGERGVPFRLQVNSLSVSHLVKHLIFYTGGDVEPRRHATARSLLHPASVQVKGRGQEAQARSGEVEQETGLQEGEVLAPVSHHHHHLCFDFSNDSFPGPTAQCSPTFPWTRSTHSLPAEESPLHRFRDAQSHSMENNKTK